MNSRISNIANTCKGNEIVNSEEIERSRFESTKPIVLVDEQLETFSKKRDCFLARKTTPFSNAAASVIKDRRNWND